MTTVTDAEVAEHFPLVHYAVGRMIRGNQLGEDIELEDVHAVGRMAVWEALRRWEPGKGAKSTYLYSYIWGYVMRYQRDATRAVGWHRALGRIARVASLDAPRGGDGATLLDVLAGHEAPPDAGARLAHLMRAGAALDEPQRSIARCLLSDEPLTNVAHELGVSPGHARKMAAGVRDALRDA